jgi:hypothetical protein
MGAVPYAMADQATAADRPQSYRGEEKTLFRKKISRRLY